MVTVQVVNSKSSAVYFCLYTATRSRTRTRNNELDDHPRRAFKFYDTRSKRTQEDRIRIIDFEQAFDACLRITEEKHGSSVNTDSKINIRYHRREEETVDRIHNHPKISQRTSLILPERPSPTLPTQ